MIENICLCISAISTMLVGLTCTAVGVHFIISDIIERKNKK